MPFRSTKTFGHELGLSAAFRQHRAESHCSLIHGYALAFKFTFEAQDLDANNWVVDFGSLKGLKQKLVNLFDHSLLVARDDPKRAQLAELEMAGLARVQIVERVGCEAFAHTAWLMANSWVIEQIGIGRVRVVEVECSEHGANSAIFFLP